MSITETGWGSGPIAELEGESGVSDEVMLQLVGLSAARMLEASAHTSDASNVADG